MLRPVLTIVAALALAGCGADDTPDPAATTTESDKAAVNVELTAKGPRTVTSGRARITGTVSPVAEVRVDGDAVEVDPDDGSWSLNVTPKRGENTYEVDASVGDYINAYETVTITRRRTKAQIARDIAERKKRQEEQRIRAAKRKAEREARIAARVANWKASAKSIPYNQLEKNADRYSGDRVKFTGQIFQIQEGDAGGTMLLSVTDEGYDYWTDNVWVNYDRNIKSAEDDIITVYGTIDGERSYETQIGGETYVPEMTARYIEE
jgi:hypothetical protein